MIREEPCACGVPIVADDADPGPAVAYHNATRRHLEWRGVRYHQCAGVEDSPCGVSVPLHRRLCRFCIGTLRLLAQRAAAA